MTRGTRMSSVTISMLLSGALIAGCDSSSSTSSPAGSPSTSSTQSVSGPVEYRNRVVGWSIEHPADWTIGDADPTQVYVVSPASFGSEEFQENLNVVVQPINDSVTLKAYGTSVIRGPGIEDVEVVSTGPTRAGALDYAAWESHIRFTYQGKPVEALQTVIILPTEADRTARLLTFSAVPDSYEDALPIAEAMIDSFRIG